MSLLQYVKKIHVENVGELPIKDGGATFQQAHFQRNFLSGINADYSGYMEKFQPALLTVPLNAVGSLSLEDLSATTNANITIELSTGESYVMTHAWFQEGVSLHEGTVQVVFCSQHSAKL